MLKVSKTLIEYRELIWALAWKNIVIRYKQAYLGLAWAVLRPLMLMLVFTLIRTLSAFDPAMMKESAAPKHWSLTTALGIVLINMVEKTSMNRM